METHHIFKSFDLHRPQSPKISSLSSLSHRGQLKSAQMPRKTPLTSRSSIKLTLSRSRLQSVSKLENPPRHSTGSSDIFPKWLMERTGFQECLSSTPNKIDIGRICAKPSKMRDMQETRELLAWCKSCPFFETLSDFTCAEVCEKLNTMHFSVGDTLLKEGEVGDKMYIILKGVVGIYSSTSCECIDEVGSNNIIGEMALESNTLRNATVMAHAPVQALLLRKDDYVNIVMRQKHKQRYIIVHFLKNISCFKEMLAAKLEVIAWNMITVRYKDKQVIYLEGQSSHSIYFVKEGAVNLDVNVTVTNRHRIPTNKKETLVEKETYEKVVRICKVGDFFGEEEVLEPSVRKTRAICCGDTEIYLIKKEFIYENLSEKERRCMIRIHDRLPTVEEVRKDVHKILRKNKIKMKAILDAASPSRRGHLYTNNEKTSHSVKHLLEKKRVTDFDNFLFKKNSFFEYK